MKCSLNDLKCIELTADVFSLDDFFSKKKVADFGEGRGYRRVQSRSVRFGNLLTRD